MTKTPSLELDSLSVTVNDGEPVCTDISLTINEGETHILLGPNGSGKSSLLSALMGVGPYHLSSGSIRLRGTDITEANVTERARLGLGLAVQHPPQLPGVTVKKLAHAMGADARVKQAAQALDLAGLVQRDINVGFSGGEAKRWEVMKLLLQEPLLCLLDEPESGVDLDHVAVVGRAVNQLITAPAAGGHLPSALMITHTGFILDHVQATTAHLMQDGHLVSSGDPRTMFESIRRDGFAA